MYGACFNYWLIINYHLVDFFRSPATFKTIVAIQMIRDFGYSTLPGKG